MDDWIVISKLVPILIDVHRVVLILVLASAIFLLLRFRKTALLILVFSILVVVIASSPITGYFYKKIERAYPPISTAATPKADAIVLLAGDVSIPIPPRVESQIRGNRVLHASRLYKAQKAPIIFVSGGNVFHQEGVEPEAYYTKDILIELGIPESAITYEGKSRNTRENALETWRILGPKNIKTVLLVTSSFHMPRAVATFEKVGFIVIPSTSSASSYETKPKVITIVENFPSLNELGRLQSVIHEYLGIAVYCYRGWLVCKSYFGGIF